MQTYTAFREIASLVRPGCLIIEDRGDEQITGTVDHTGAHAHGLGVGWMQRGGGYRDTDFDRELWQIERQDRIIFLRRLAPNRPDIGCDQPWPEAELYTVILPT